MSFVPHKWFAEQAGIDRGAGLDADGLPGQGSSFWDGVPPVDFGCNSGGSGGRNGTGMCCDGSTVVYRRFVNGPHKFVWLVTMYDEATNTAYGCSNLNYDDYDNNDGNSGGGGSGGGGGGSGGGRWGLIPMKHVRMLGGRADASWKPLPYSDALRHRARVSAPYTRVQIPPHSLVGFDAWPSPAGASCAGPCGKSKGRGPQRTIVIPRRRMPCGLDAETGEPRYEYSYVGVPQDKAVVLLDTIYLSGDDMALGLAALLNDSYGYAVRVCQDDGRCPLCTERPCSGGNGGNGSHAPLQPPASAAGRK